MFDPRREPCGVCGREPDECVCSLAPDFDDSHLIPELDDPDFLDWGDEDPDDLDDETIDALLDGETTNKEK